MKIVALTDYKDHFGSKDFDKSYRSGMDKGLLTQYIKEQNCEIEFVQFSEIVNEISKYDKDVSFIYTSSEDIGYKYKSFIEDVILFLETSGYNVIPKYKYLRANNNKVFMELLRTQTHNKDILGISSNVFGVKEELEKQIESIEYPVVVKMAEGSCGVGVYMANSAKELRCVIKKVSKTKAFYYDLWDLIRSYKYEGYIKESRFRNKFIVQNMIKNLSNDYKVLVYGNKAYVLFRGNRDNDFRASGSGKFQFYEKIPEGMLDYAYSLKTLFNVPNISIDIVFDGEKFHLIEFQFLYFGTSTLVKSPYYYINKDNKWSLINEKSNLEKVYVDSIVNYISQIK